MKELYKLENKKITLKAGLNIINNLNTFEENASLRNFIRKIAKVCKNQNDFISLKRTYIRKIARENKNKFCFTRLLFIDTLEELKAVARCQDYQKIKKDKTFL